ncbi:hypothetical protein ABT127_15885 [Streptomyces sp. NPDC001904]|uniref:hypothetical protein n=1 Tax=Streptomyces sp. NPDC001904 TaxID=3154531 RepID=UPI00332DA284
MPAAPPHPDAPNRPDVPNRPAHERPHARLRLFGLLAVVVLTAALPLAGATAGPVDDGPARPVAEQAGSPRSGTADKVDDSPARDAHAPDGAGAHPDAARPPQGAPLLKSLGLGLATATHCGPQLASPDGVEAQTCVLTQGRDTWGRTYYRNATGAELGAVLTLMAPGGRTVQIHCAVGAEDEPGLCETPREPTRGQAAEYAAVAEYAATGDGPLLLRSGSNSAPARGR